MKQKFITKKLCFSLWIFIFSFNFTLNLNAQSYVNTESGVLFTGLNNIKNGPNASIFSLKDDLRTPPSFFLRCRAGFSLKNKHNFSILYAPLSLTATGLLERDILYDGEVFKSQNKIEAIYKFDSYRFTYNRKVLNNEAIEVGLGGSIKIRYAGSSLKNKDFLEENFSIGFVPLMNLFLSYDISEKIDFIFFGEGIATNKGRAIDASISGKYLFTKNLHGNIGYRILEGGFNGSVRYNFIQIHFLFARLTFLYSR